jgi:serine/threonine-protein kinase HipA
MRRDIVVDEDGTVLDVCYEEHVVGRLTRRTGVAIEDSIEFAYDPKWMSLKGAFPLSVTMPLTQQEYSGIVLYHWFLNLLPEGSHRKLAGDILKVDKNDVFGLISRMGNDLAGAIEIRKPGQAMSKGRYQTLTETELARLIGMLPRRPVLAGENGVQMSLAGAQEKLAVARSASGAIALALDGAASTHILKPGSKRYRNTVENEAFCLRLARAVGLEVPDVHIGKAGNHDYILVSRYDRFWDPVRKKIRRLQQEDFCQTTSTPPDLKYERNNGLRGPTVADCFKVLDHTAIPGSARAAFLDYFVFNVLVGNTDAHAKNYSLVHSSRGWSMSPLYDVLQCDVYEDVIRTIPMRIAGKNEARHIHARHWDKFSVENGLSAVLVKRRVAAMADKILKEAPKLAAIMNEDHPSMIFDEMLVPIADICRRMKANLGLTPLPADGNDKDGQETDLPAQTPGL